MRMVPGAGHVIAEESPDVVNAALLEFLGEDSSGVASRAATA
jgi:pimeloyl-ACP methyl ester carboxylesterase